MGKEVSYCLTCGRRLGVGDAAENQVYVHDGRRYCAACRPAGAGTRVPMRRSTSTKLRAPSPAPRVKETTRIRRPGRLRLVLAGAGAVALAVGVAVAAGGGKAPEPGPARPSPEPAPSSRPAADRPDPGPSVDELLARVRDVRQSDLLFERREDVRRLLLEAAGKAGSRLEEIDLVAAEYDRAFEEAAARLADFTRSEAVRLAGRQNYAEAIARLDRYPTPFRVSKAAAALRLLRADYERRLAPALPDPAAPPKQGTAAPAWPLRG